MNDSTFGLNKMAEKTGTDLVSARRRTRTARLKLAGLLAAVPLVATSAAVVADSHPAGADTWASRISTNTRPVLDSQGATWQPAAGFSGARAATAASTSTPISGTADDALYRTGLFGPTMGFAEKVPDGIYTVTLKFSENYFHHSGYRVFNVSAQGQRVLSNVDIYAAVGGNAAYDRTFRVTVAGGTLRLGFDRIKDNPLVSAIAISKVTVTAPPPPPNTTITPPLSSSTPVPVPTASGTGTSSAPTGPAPSTSSASPAPVTSTASPTPAPTSSAPVTSSAAPAPTSSAPTATPTPAPTSTAPVSPPKSGRPDSSNTGVPEGTHLTPYYGDLTITTPNAHYDALDIHGFVTVRAPNVTISRSIIRGSATKSFRGLVNDVDLLGFNFQISDSELVPSNPSVYIDGIDGFGYTAVRLDIHGTVDGAKMWGSNTSIVSSYIHDLVYYDSDPNQGGGHTHNDGVQILGGNNLRVVNSSLSGGYNSAMQVTQTRGLVTNLDFTGNYADGGGCSVNINVSPLPTMTTVSVTDNLFGRNTRVANCAIVYSRAATLKLSNNDWDGTSQPAGVKTG